MSMRMYFVKNSELKMLLTSFLCRFKKVLISNKPSHTCGGEQSERLEVIYCIQRSPCVTRATGTCRYHTFLETDAYN